MKNNSIRITFEPMKRNFLFTIAAIIFLSLNISCKKTSFITSDDAFLFTSTDTLHFGTVFTNTGSITQSFKIFNPNDQKLLLSNVELASGTTSVFTLNVNGVAGETFSNIEIAPNDSMYVFVAANANTNSTNLPLLIQDSVSISYNGKTSFVQLDAYGQNALFLTNASATKDTVWNNDLPIVITGAFTVNQGKTLTINKGTQVFCHADAQINVNGSLKALGEKEDDKIIFRGDRLDDYYNNLPGSWPGIVFKAVSTGNILNYTSILNARQAINCNTALTLNQCIINNASDAGIFSDNSNITATNCLISNCANNIKITNGGTYNFKHCTVVSYNSNLLYHETAVLSVSNTDENNGSFPLTANFTNSIFYGDDGFVTDEIIVQQAGSAAFSVRFENVLYKAADVVAADFTNCIQNTDPAFVTIDYTNNKFDFHLLPESPCVNTAKPIGVGIDLDGNSRDNTPDIGCYELQ